MILQKDFTSRFSFNPNLVGYMGIEREHFLISAADNNYTPQSAKFLKAIRNSLWTYELSACQVESRTRPQVDLAAIEMGLLANENIGKKISRKLGLILLDQEVAEINMPLNVYPNPRYLKIARNIPVETLRAACRVAGTHVHIGVSDLVRAIAINNLLVPHFDALCSLGDHSSGERLRLYKTMATNWRPMLYRNPEHLFEVAEAESFTDNPRNCWKLIRISIHGTVELRMFGSTNDIDEILEWVSFIKSIIKGVL